MIPESITDVANAIQLALAPVFLLTSVAGMLNVMSGRLSRIIDRGRVLTDGKSEAEQASFHTELQNLEKRRHLVSTAITAGTISALLVCVLIIILFLEVLLSAHLQWLMGLLFVLATLALSVGLGYFLREVHMATRTVRIRIGSHRHG